MSVPTIDLLRPNPDRQKRQVSSDLNDEYALTDRGKVEGTEATFARENENQGPPIFFLIN